LSYDPMSPNMTPEKLDEIMATMPPKMEESEVCALTLTIYRAYMDNPGDIIANLISTIYSLGLSIGLDYETISEGLRQTADMQDEDYRKGVRH
jgi:hypothetical protein